MLPSYLSDADLDALIQRALDEDVGDGDVTTQATVPEDTQAHATITAKEPGIVAGLYVAQRVFAHLDASVAVEWGVADGAQVQAGDVVGHLHGSARPLLIGERLALNIMQRMSGIATATGRMVDAARPHAARILDTRKTAPGLRLLDKWAVRLGGGSNHRVGLYDLILIKDNHITAAGGIEAALNAARRYRDDLGSDLRIEIETRTLDEVRAVLHAGGADIVLLDNMVLVEDDGTVNTGILESALALINGRMETEASGNVTLDTVAAIAATGVDAISSGALTHSVRALDLSMGVMME